MFILDKLIIISMIIFPISLLVFGLLISSTSFKGRIRNSEDVEAFSEFFKIKIVKTSFLALAISSITLFGGITAFTEIMENKIKNDLKNFQSKSDKLFINGKLSESPIRVIKEIIKYYPVYTNHSTPTKELKIKALINNREINLSLARDSNDSTIYWVFLPEYTVTKNNVIWKAKTNLFNKYK
jgi:hypothetical protein